MSSENDDNSIQSKKSAIWTSLSNFLLSLYLPLNFNKDIPHFQFVNSFDWFNSDSLKFTLGVDGISMPFIVLSTFLILLCVIYIYPQKKKICECILLLLFY
jgi:NADH-quinone oxidoreductase subunit M